jgi:hypothetical protein
LAAIRLAPAKPAHPARLPDQNTGPRLEKFAAARY